MREVCLACIGFILEMTIFFAAGRLLSKALKLKEDISLQLILGYLVYFAVLEVVVVPMTLLWVPLNRAAALWVVLLAIMLAGGCFLLRRNRKKAASEKQKKTHSVRLFVRELWNHHSLMLLAG